MEPEDNFLDTKTAGGVIISACCLYKHFALFSALLLIVSLVKVFDLHSFLLCASVFILFALCQFYCIRLNLDSKLFEVMYHNIDEIQFFDKGIQTLFNKNNKERTLEDRWKGTKILLKNACCILALQIILAVYVWIL